ncbi:hypothetical protein CVS40_7625 [Lucilia cuprina]|nr:hypothetical protein CVS40_7625 [Lucilia cuprina]
MGDRKRKAINRVNSKRGKVPSYDNRELYMKNPGGAQRQKTAKRFLKYNANNPNKMDLANIKRPLKTFSGTAMLTILVTYCCFGWPMHESAVRILEVSRPRRVMRCYRVSLSTN